MKILFKFSFLLLVLGLSFTACKKAPKGTKAETTAAANNAATAKSSDTKYKIDSGQLNWTATKVGGQHMGTVNISSGDLAASNGTVSSGTVNIDMTSINVTDLEDKDKKAKLEGHLASPDFFDVAANPTATFKITGVTTGVGEANATVSGDLTIKGNTKNISFPANIISAGNKISVVTPPFKINRTEWDVKYGSGLIGTAKDKIIHDEIGLVLNLQGSSM